jgi:hypothetical protein
MFLSILRTAFLMSHVCYSNHDFCICVTGLSSVNHAYCRGRCPGYAAFRRYGHPRGLSASFYKDVTERCFGCTSGVVSEVPS